VQGKDYVRAENAARFIGKNNAIGTPGTERGHLLGPDERAGLSVPGKRKGLREGEGGEDVLSPESDIKGTWRDI